MALRTASMSGFWDLAATWGGAAPPAGADTFATSTWTVTVRTAGGAAGCAGGTITAGGKLSIQSTAGFTMTGAVAWIGTFEMLGSGSNITPTLLTLTGSVWTIATTGVINIVGTLAYTTPDVKIVGNNASYFYFFSRPSISGVLTKAEFNTFGSVNGPLYAMANHTGNIAISDLYFKNIASHVFSSAFVYFTGTLYCTGCGGAFLTSASLYGTGTVLIETPVAPANGGMSTGYVFGTVKYRVNATTGASSFSSNSSLAENSSLEISELGSDTSLTTVRVLNNASLTLTTTTNGRTFLASCVTNTNGSIVINGANGLTFISNGFFYCKSTRITVTTGTVALTTALSGSYYWQSSRSISFAIVGSTAITLNGTGASAPQFEPVLFQYDLTNYLFGITYHLNYFAPNYTALYGASTGWTAATNTLAAGGVLRIYTTGHTATGMNMAISSFAGFTLATSGTAAYTAEYYVSFDGGVLWSAALSLAQLQSNTYIINGNTYNTDPRNNIQLRIALTSAGGGTITQVRVTGITYNPAVTSSWDIRGNLERIEGSVFDTNNDSLHQISTHKIGVPVALDGGLATISGNLTKMADDNNGADFDSTTDSLHALGTAIAAIAAAIAALLAPILRGVNWLIMAFKKVFKGKINND